MVPFIQPGERIIGKQVKILHSTRCCNLPVSRDILCHCLTLCGWEGGPEGSKSEDLP